MNDRSRYGWCTSTMSCCKCLDDRCNRRTRFIVCFWFIVWSLGNASLSALLIFDVIQSLPGSTTSPATSVEVGGNVPVLLNLSDFDPLRYAYDQVQVTGLTAGSNTTLLLGLCEDLSTVRVPLRPKNVFFKNSSKSSLPFNYHGGDTPVYSAGGNGSFISYNISAEATGDSHNDSHQLCGAQLINFNNLTSYMVFINNQTTYQSFSLPNCIPVGPPGSPSTSSVMFSLYEPGFYRQAVLVNTSLSINSSVTGSLSSYNTSSLESAVFCNTEKCTIQISALTQNSYVCVLVQTDGEYTAVVIRAVESFNNEGGLKLSGYLLCGTILVWNAIMLVTPTLMCICKRTGKCQTVSYMPEKNSVFFLCQYCVVQVS